MNIPKRNFTVERSIKNIQKNIEELVALEGKFKGEGGQPIRSFYECLAPATGPASLVTKAGKPKSINTPDTGNTTKALEGIQKETKEFYTDFKNGGTIFVNELSNLINRSLFPHQGLQMSMANQMPVNVFSRTAIEDRIDSVVSRFAGKKVEGVVKGTSNRDTEVPPAFRQTDFASSYEERYNQTPSPVNSKIQFEGIRGESLSTLKPPPDPVLKRLLDEAGIKGIQYKNGVPDFSP